VRGLRVGVVRNYFFEGIDPDVERAFGEAMATLRRLGAEVRDVQIPSLAATHSFLLIMLAEAYAYHERDLREHPELYGDVLRERLLAGALVTGAEYVQAQRIRSGICRETAAVLRDVDVLATPTTPKPATPFAQAHDPEFGFPRSNMPPFNITGSPTLALPCGFSASGLPVSLQLAGRPFDEATVLQVGHAYEQATGWHTRRPPV
jgi:aspartyl-tRNA(Asn)/glutamyl-tRNA(Gln) amidotransferase subunit A